MDRKLVIFTVWVGIPRRDPTEMKRYNERVLKREWESTYIYELEDFYRAHLVLPMSSIANFKDHILLNLPQNRKTMGDTEKRLECSFRCMNSCSNTRSCPTISYRTRVRGRKIERWISADVFLVAGASALEI